MEVKKIAVFDGDGCKDRFVSTLDKEEINALASRVKEEDLSSTDIKNLYNILSDISRTLDPKLS